MNSSGISQDIRELDLDLKDITSRIAMADEERHRVGEQSKSTWKMNNQLHLR